jgi:hypothetical protein
LAIPDRRAGASLPRALCHSGYLTRPTAAEVGGFIETARKLEADEDKERFEEKLGKFAKAKPPPVKSKAPIRGGLAKLALIGCLGLAACAPANWYKIGATQADHDRDIRECQSAAQRSAIGGRNPGLAVHSFFNLCMTARGYKLRR